MARHVLCLRGLAAAFAFGGEVAGSCRLGTVFIARCTRRCLLLAVRIIPLQELGLPLRLAQAATGVPQYFLAFFIHEALPHLDLILLRLLQSTQIQMTLLLRLKVLLSLYKCFARSISDLSIVLFRLVRDHDSRTKSAISHHFLWLNLLVFQCIHLQSLLLLFLCFLHSLQCFLVAFP